MKNLKKIMLTGALTLATIFAMQALSNAATVKVTGEVVNIRKEASTDSKVVAQLSENVECEYLGEEGNWYKVKYQKYTGYISKEYTKLIGEANNSTSNTENNQSNNSQGEEPKLIYKKFNKEATIKILPLIHSTNIGEAKKEDEVLILTETSGWSYIQTEEINGWVRADTLGQASTVANGNNSNEGNTATTTEKIGYISEEEVNMRKGAGTSYSIIKVLTLNTQVTILKEEGKWYQVKVEDNTGYVSKDYVSDSKTVANRSLTEPRTVNEDNVTNNEENNSTNKTESNTTSTNKLANSSTINEEKNSVSTSTASKEKNTVSSNTKDKVTNTVATTSSHNENNSSTDKNKTTSKDTTKGSDIIAYAKSFMGVPYVWGGASKSRI